MIQAYAGEFTISPIPLEMSMNWCSHNCHYCFANLNQPGRKLDTNKVINQIKNCKKGKGLTSYLLANGYPVLLSNRVDPFAHTNWRQSLSFIEMLHENGNKIAFQTKGGPGIDQTLEMLDYKSNWYVSISMLNDDIRKLIEPGAPSISERFELIEKLINKGHHVSVGINPLVEEWLPITDFEALVDKLTALGVRDFWIENLHLNPKQVKNMPANGKRAIGEDIINESKKRKRNISYFIYCCNYLLGLNDINIYSINQPFRSHYFNSYNHYKSLKTHQEFINYCFEKYPNGGEIKWHEYYSFMSQGTDFYEKEFTECDGYIYRIARNVYKTITPTKKPFRTLKSVLEAYWDYPNISKSLLSNGLFSVLSFKDGKEIGEYECKEDGAIIYYFHAKPENQWRHFV